MHTETDTAIGARVTQLREARSLTPEALAGQIGLDTATLLRLEAGVAVFGDEVLWRLSQALDVRVSYLVGGDMPEPTPEELRAFVDSVEDDALREELRRLLDQ